MPDRYDDGSWGEGGDPQIEAQNAPTASLNDLNAQIQASPVFRQWIAAHRGGRNLSEDEKADLLQTLIAAGFQLDPNLRISDDASVEPISHDTRNLILVGAMLAPLTFPGSGSAGAVGATGTGGAGTTGAVGGATGGAGATSGLAGSSYVVPSASLGGAGGTAGTTAALYGGGEAGLVGSSYTVPSATLGANGGTVAAGGGGLSLGKRLFNSIVGDTAEERLQTGLNLAGNLIQSRQTSKAVDAQVAAANRALDLQRDIYLQQRSDLMPYADMGRGAIGDMGRMTGTTPVSAPTLASLSQPSGPSSSGVTGERGAPPPHDGNPNNAPVTGQAVPRAGSLSTLGSAGMVNMISPDGRPARVPQNQVQQALAAGGRMA